MNKYKQELASTKLPRKWLWISLCLIVIVSVNSITVNAEDVTGNIAKRKQNLHRWSEHLKKPSNEKERASQLENLAAIANSVSANAYRDRTLSPAIRPLLMDENKSVRMYAMMTLSSLKDEQSCDTIKRMSREDKNDGIRKAAIFEYGKCAREGSINYLLSYLNGKDPSATLKAITALALLGNKAGYETAKQYLTSPDEEIRNEAVVCVGYFANMNDVRLINQMITDGKIRTLDGFDATIRIEFLNCQSNSEKTQYLLSKLQDPNGDFRSTAASFFEQLSDDTAAMQALVEFSHSNSIGHENAKLEASRLGLLDYSSSAK